MPKAVPISDQYPFVFISLLRAFPPEVTGGQESVMLGVSRKQALDMLARNRDDFSWAVRQIELMETSDERYTEPRGRYIYAGFNYVQEEDEVAPDGTLIPKDDDLTIRQINDDSHGERQIVGKIVPNIWCEDLISMKCF